MRQISPGLIQKTQKWLGKDGIAFFRGIKEEHGGINVCWMEGDIPHAVHFREGMQVRNFMRSTEECRDWNAHELDDTWIQLIEKCL